MEVQLAFIFMLRHCREGKNEAGCVCVCVCVCVCERERKRERGGGQHKKQLLPLPSLT